MKCSAKFLLTAWLLFTVGCGVLPTGTPRLLSGKVWLVASEECGQYSEWQPVRGQPKIVALFSQPDGMPISFVEHGKEAVITESRQVKMINKETSESREVYFYHGRSDATSGWVDESCVSSRKP